MMNHPEIVKSLKLPRKNYIVSVLLLESRRWVRGAARIARQPSKLKALGSNPSGPALILDLRLEFGRLFDQVLA